MRHCLFCQEPLGEGVPEAPARGRQHAYDPHLGRLWEICSGCRRWNPVPMELRWETLDGWEEAVRDRGRIIVSTENLALVRVDRGEVVRVQHPPLPEWGGWRYGERLPAPRGRRGGFLRRLIGGLPPAPLEGYDPYGLSGPMGGVSGAGGPSQWLGSPFLETATHLTVAFAALPFAPECPSCLGPLPLNPWEFQEVTFRESSELSSGEGRPGRIGVEVHCALCGNQVLLSLRAARPALRLGLGIVDSGPRARREGEEAGLALARVGGSGALISGLGRMGAPLGELGLRERVAVGIALDDQAEAEALEAEWREAEEIAAIMDGELTEVEGFRAFRERILGQGESEF
jgi:hypothetical protein